MFGLCVSAVGAVSPHVHSKSTVTVRSPSVSLLGQQPAPSAVGRGASTSAPRPTPLLVSPEHQAATPTVNDTADIRCDTGKSSRVSFHVAEVTELRVDEYLSRPNWKEAHTGELEMALSPADRLLSQMYTFQNPSSMV